MCGGLGHPQDIQFCDLADLDANLALCGRDHIDTVFERRQHARDFTAVAAQYANIVCCGTSCQTCAGTQNQDAGKHPRAHPDPTVHFLTHHCHELPRSPKHVGGDAGVPSSGLIDIRPPFGAVVGDGR